MKITAKTAPSLPKTDLLVVLATESQRLELPAGIELASAAKRGFEGKPRNTRATDAKNGTRVVLVGLGPLDKVDAEGLRRAAALGAKAAEAEGAARAALWTPEAVLKAVGAEVAGWALAEGAAMGSYRFDACRGKASKEKAKLGALVLLGGGAPFQRGVERGVILAEANAFTRDLQNLPGNLMRPRDVAAAARKLTRRSQKITCRVHDERAMARMGMGLLLGVSQGSSEPAQLIHLTYKPRGRKKGVVAFVGKGLTFDAGGISLKPSAKMEEMKYDMSGGAAVLGAFHALAALDVPFEVHGIVAASENLPDGKATKPGDVHTGMNGMTVEVQNTDAEGRLILGDALTYTTQKVKPDTIIDLATLTGAVVVALGHELGGLFATTERLRDDLLAAGTASGERLWPLPLEQANKDQMKGTVADLKNINSPGQGAGSSSGAAFLSNFVGDTEWAHLDIAGTAWNMANRDYVGGSLGTGFGARLLIQYLEERR